MHAAPNGSHHSAGNVSANTTRREGPYGASAGGTLTGFIRQRLKRAGSPWLLAILAGLLVIYLPSLRNPLLFDDSYLTGALQAKYASWQVHARMVSYGSFVWLQALLGEGWWKQRLVNVAIHCAVVLALWGLYRELLRSIAQDSGRGAEAPRPDAALAFAVGFFALNPVAVYAVAYLIQRSTLLATLFVVAGLWAFAAGLRSGRLPLLALAVACYPLAVLSKEAAVLGTLAAIPVYILVRRPPAVRLASVVAAAALLMVAAGAILWQRYGAIIGAPFDEYSRVYLAQLGALNPEAPRHAYALSIINEAWLFLRYGAQWLLPYAGWMSINMRPPFPVSWLSFPHSLGLLAYPAVLALGAWLLLRYRDRRALLGVSLLFPALLYPTEFATVWVQDPYVLYRSYLWAIGIPGIVFLAVEDVPVRALAAVGVVVGGLLAWQALDRVLSLQDPETAWTDAIAKLSSDPRAVGRWVPYLNRGSAYVDSDNFSLALLDFESSAALGDLGMGSFNAGALLSARGRQQEALKAFDRAEKEGYSLYNLPFQRGLALLALGRAQEALAQFERARALDPPSPTRELTLLHIGRVALRLGKAREALDALAALARLQPANREAKQLMATALLMDGQPERAREVLDGLIAEHASGPAYYVRALANYRLGRKAAALSDIDDAIRAGGDNPNLREWRAKILAMP
jgi:tetratricopeptide (TPR) repeat protein